MRYTFYDVNAYQPFGFVAFASSPISLPGFGIFLQQRSQNVAISETHIFSPTLIGEFKVRVQPNCRRTGAARTTTVDFAQQFNIAGRQPRPG